MLSQDSIFSFEYECEESCFFDSYIPSDIILQVSDASLIIDEINWSNISNPDALNLQYSAKSNKNSEKLAAVVSYIDENNLIWIAEETEFSQLRYSEKAISWGSDYRSFGFEFYSYGFYSVFGPSSSSSVMNYGYADNFDWRNRHNSNMEDSPYYNAGGEGWVTPAVCQGLGCWYNNEFLCNTNQNECDALGGIYREAATCWIFGPTAHIEALTNLYYNEFINVDLSEQYIACEENTVGRNTIYNALKHYKNEGVPDEDCLHYSASLENCDDLCTSPSERIWIDDYTRYINPTDEETRQYLMEYGSVTAELIYFPWGTGGHSMALIGWGVIDEDALGVTGIGTPIDESWYGTTYWIFKESSGPGVHHNGFRYIIDWDNNSNIYTIDRHIVRLNRNDDDVNCFDKDGDGYYFWGIGNKPSYCDDCPAEPDGDDSDPGLGPINEFGACAIINSYNANFENSWNNWVQVGGDDLDWWRHEGPTETNNTGPEEAQDGDFYIYVMSNCNGCYPFKEAIIESPPINLSNFCEGQIDFHYHMDTYKWGNPVENELILQISYDNGATWESDFWSMAGDTGEEWQFASLKFPSTVTKFRFIAITGDTYMSEMALDNITISPSQKENTPIVISTDTPWNVDQTINSDVIIENGATLTISNCNISMHEQARIIVKNGDETTPGSKLVVDNATIKCQCDHSFWQGIQVWGNRNEPQMPKQNEHLQQGTVELKNDATIKNAIIAIDLWEPDNYASTGGVLTAEDAFFRNNKKSVHALYYTNFNPYYPEVEWDCFTKFKNCSFEITDDYPEKEIFYKHVDLAHIKGVKFYGCDFSISENANGIFEWNYAIAGYDAKFEVKAICNSQQLPCPEISLDKSTFTGFYSAVNANNDGQSAVTFSVSQCDFINNENGVLTSNMDNATVLYSDFEIGTSHGCGAGIHSDRVNAFTFEENDFSKYVNAPLEDYYGITVLNSEDVNEIYRNTFNGLSFGNYSDGQNWIELRSQGLAYYCNENTNNYADFYVEDDLDYNGFGIQSGQGNENLPAGNTFSTSGATWHFYNGARYDIDYFTNTTNSNISPEKITENINLHPLSTTNTCPSNFSGNPKLRLIVTAEEKTDAELEYYSSLTDYNSTKSLYDSYINGGDTEDEINDIQSAQPEDMWALHAQLLGDSPHLSFEVLKEASDKTDVFTESALFDILAANPDELKKDTLISYLENKEDPLPDYMIALLEQIAEGTTYKTALLNQMSEYKHNYVRAANLIVRSILNDSIMDYTALRNWLDNIGGINSDRRIISSYIEQGNFTDAFTLANMLPSLYELQGNNSVEHTYYIDMLNLYQTIHQEGRTTYQLSNNEKAYIDNIAQNSSGIAGSQSKSILQAVYKEYCDICPNVGNSASHKSDRFISNDDINKIYGLDVSAKPNPASYWVAFDYTLPKGHDKATISLRNISGKIIDVIKIEKKQGQELWNISHIPSGAYVYTIESSGFTKSGKLIITK